MSLDLSVAGIAILISMASGVVSIYTNIHSRKLAANKIEKDETERRTYVGFELSAIKTQLSEMKIEILSRLDAMEKNARADHDDITALKRDVKTLFEQMKG